MSEDETPQDTARTQAWRRFLAQWVGFAVRRAPWIVLAFLVLGAGALVFTKQNIRVDTDREKMLSGDLPFRLTEARKKELFPQFADNLVLVVDATTPEDARAGARGMAEALAARGDLFHDVYVPRADPFLESHGLLFLNEVQLEDLSQRLAEVQPFLGRLTGDESLRGFFGLLAAALEADTQGTHVDLTRVLTRVRMAVEATLRNRTHRLSWQELMRTEPQEPDDRRQYVLARPVIDYDRGLFPAGPAIDAVRTAARELQRPAAGLRVRITGGLAMSHEELQTVSRGAEWFALGVLVAVGLILVIGLRSLRLVLASIVTLLVGLMLTAGFATAAIGHLNLISVAFGVLYIGLGIDYAIHLGLRYREGIHGGLGHDPALRQAAQDVGGSLVLCSLSTALGFYAFVPTAYAGVSELGLISGTGMFISLVLNLTLLPALLTLMPLRSREMPHTPAGDRWRDAFATFPVRRYRPVLVGSVVLVAGGLALLPRIDFDFNPLNLRDRQSESVATFDELLETSSTPPWNIDALAEDAEAARDLARRLEALPEVGKVITLDDFVPGRQDAKLAVLEDTALILGLDTIQRGAGAEPTAAETQEATRALVVALEAYGARETGGTDRAEARRLADALRRYLEAASGAGEGALTERLSDSLLATLPANMERLRTSLQASGFTQAELPPQLAARWVAPDGTHRVQAFAKRDLRDPEALERFVKAVRGVVPEASGSPVVMLESGRAVTGAFRQALLVAVLATATVLLVLLRNVRDVLFVLVPLLAAGVLTVAVMILFGVPFNFANVIALPLLLGIGVDNGIHMVDRARHGVGGARNVNPLRTSTARAVVFSTLTTACSFGQLALSPHPGTASMGLLLTVGMACLLACTLVLIPALLAFGDARATRGRTASASASTAGGSGA